MAPGAEGEGGAGDALADAEAADRALGQWWEDGDEPQYFVVSPVAVAVGKPSGAQDRVTWLLDHERHEEALEIIDTGKAIDRVLVEDVSESLYSICRPHVTGAKPLALTHACPSCEKLVLAHRTPQNHPPRCTKT